MCSGWTAGLEALDFALYQIAQGRVDGMIVGAVDQLFPALVAGLDARGLTSRTGTPRPYDRRRNGAVMSEGACFLVIESIEHAQARGQRMYAEVAALAHRNTVDGDGAKALCTAVRLALRESETSSDEIGLVVSGANGAAGDRCEGEALAASMGSHADEIPIMMPKAIVGETMASGGPLAVGLAAMALHHGTLAATSDPEHDPACRLRIRRRDSHGGADVALIPLIADDGNAAAAVLRRIA
jgi:3-oxoacyl-[acyl-carrier-protein] synthase II